jgi:hypothetical protein
LIGVLEVRTTSLVGVSASGAVSDFTSCERSFSLFFSPQVAVWTQRPFEPHWGVMRAELDGDIVLTAAAVSYRRGGLVIAAAGPSFGNIVSMYEVALEFEKQQMSLHLTARVTLPEAGVPSQLQLNLLPTGLLRLLATRVPGSTVRGTSEVWEEHLGVAPASAPAATSPLQVVNPADDAPTHAISWKRLFSVQLESGLSLAQFLSARYLLFAYEDGRMEYRYW